MTDGWSFVPGSELGRYVGHIVAIYRSTIPTRIVEVTEPDVDAGRELVVEWTQPTSAIGGLIRHEAGRRERIPLDEDDEYYVRIDDPSGHTCEEPK